MKINFFVVVFAVHDGGNDDDDDDNVDDEVNDEDANDTHGGENGTVENKKQKLTSLSVSCFCRRRRCPTESGQMEVRWKKTNKWSSAEWRSVHCSNAGL